MNKHRAPFVLKVVLALLVSSSIIGCGGGHTPIQTAPGATASPALDTGRLGLPLYCPGYVTHDQQGNIYVSDSDEGNQNSHRARVVKLSSTGQLLREWHVFTAFHGRLKSGPFGLDVDSSGNIYIADAGDNTIKKLSPTGTLLVTWGKTGSAPGEFSFPEGVAIGPQGNVYVADFHNSRIQEFSSTGTLLAVFGNTGSSSERLNNPVGIAIDGQGNVYVADIRNHSIVKFSSAGKFLGAWDHAGSKTFSSAKAMAVDGEGNIYVADSGNQRIVKLTPTGQVLTILEKVATTAGGLFGITVDLQGNIYYAEYDSPGEGIRKLSPSGVVLATWPATCIPPG